MCPVQTTAEVAPEEAIRQLQTMMPPPPRSPPEPVILENVSPGLLLPPAGRGLVGTPATLQCAVLITWPAATLLPAGLLHIGIVLHEPHCHCRCHRWQLCSHCVLRPAGVVGSWGRVVDVGHNGLVD
jgi:hypothetical protein